MTLRSSEVGPQFSQLMVIAVATHLYKSYMITYVTLDHKTSHKGQFILINNLSIDVWLVMIGQYL